MPWHHTVFRDLCARAAQLPHALLLHGKKGTGKHRFAATLVRTLLCEEASEPDEPCGRCPSCGWLAADVHPDFRRVEPLSARAGDDEAHGTRASTQIIVEQVRALSDFLSLSTHRGGRRVVLVEPAEALNTNAANALLKSLEEPPPRTLFLLISHRPYHVLPTIKSRCQLLPLPSPTEDAAAAWLRTQGIRQPELAVAHAGGAPLIAMELPREDYWDQRREFLVHLATAGIDPVATAQQWETLGPPLVLEWLQKWTYDIALRRHAGRVRYNIDHESLVERISSTCDPSRMLRLHRQLVHLQRHAHHPLNARLFLEQVFMAYAEAAAPRSPGA